MHGTESTAAQTTPPETTPTQVPHIRPSRPDATAQQDSGVLAGAGGSADDPPALPIPAPTGFLSRAICPPTSRSEQGTADELTSNPQRALERQDAIQPKSPARTLTHLEVFAPQVTQFGPSASVAALPPHRATFSANEELSGLHRPLEPQAANQCRIAPGATPPCPPAGLEEEEAGTASQAIEGIPDEAWELADLEDFFGPDAHLL